MRYLVQDLWYRIHDYLYDLFRSKESKLKFNHSVFHLLNKYNDVPVEPKFKLYGIKGGKDAI